MRGQTNQGSSWQWPAIATVIVDKNWKAVTQITDRNVILVKGRVVFEGSSAELLSKPDLLAEYLGI